MCLALIRIATPARGITMPVLQPRQRVVQPQPEDKQSRKRTSRGRAAMLAACVFACIAAASIWIKSRGSALSRHPKCADHPERCSCRSFRPRRTEHLLRRRPAGLSHTHVRSQCSRRRTRSTAPKLDGMVPLDTSRDHSQILLAQYTTSVSAESFPRGWHPRHPF